MEINLNVGNVIVKIQKRTNMCIKKQFKYCPSKIDECMKEEIKQLNKEGMITLSCCCGHGKYPKTIIAIHPLNNMPYEIHTKKYLPRKKKFYKKDKDGYYFIPETVLDNT